MNNGVNGFDVLNVSGKLHPYKSSAVHQWALETIFKKLHSISGKRKHFSLTQKKCNGLIIYAKQVSNFQERKMGENFKFTITELK